jgi:phosphomannomutase
MDKYRNIFRAYDIRGIFGEDLTPTVAVKIGGALSKHFPGVYCVCSDLRSSSQALKMALSSGLLGSGQNVVDAGLGPIGMAIYATKHLGHHVAYVTASHLPPEWNGIKLFKPNGLPICEEDLEKLAETVEREDFWVKAGGEGKYVTRDVLSEYYDFLLKVPKKTSRKLKIVVDCGNGAASLVVPRLLRDLGHDVIGINCDVDPLFRVRGSEPTPETTSFMGKLIRDFNADLGVSFDGDGDRALFFDEKGNTVTPEQAALVMLKAAPPGDVVANVECSSVVERFVQDRGGKVVKVPVGRIHMIFQAMKSNIVLGVESSGHYIPYGGVNLDDGILAVLQLIEALGTLDAPLSSLLVPMPLLRKIKIEISDEVKFRVVDWLKNTYLSKYEKVSTIDGVRVDLEDGWFLVRASNTEPAIRVTIESNNTEGLDRIEKMVRKDIEQAMKSLGSSQAKK